MNVFGTVKTSINTREAVEHYGIEVNRYGKALCPFHNDRHPSLFVDDDHYHRGFTMSVAFDSMWKTYTLTLKGQMTHRVELGSDARGNLVRIENALDKMPERLRSVQEQLENLLTSRQRQRLRSVSHGH